MGFGFAMNTDMVMKTPDPTPKVQMPIGSAAVTAVPDP
jgi:hypothetical protein